MRQVSLREFRTRGLKALQAVPRGGTVLLAGQQGPAYFLIPVLGGVAIEDRELRRTMAKASLRKNQRMAEQLGSNAVSIWKLLPRSARSIPTAFAGRPNRCGWRCWAPT